MNEETENSNLPEKVNPILDPDAAILDKVREFGRLKYPKERIALLLGMSEEHRQKFFLQFNDTESEIRKAYEQGLVLGDVEIDIALAETAKTGDTFTAAELSYRQYYQRIDNLRKELFGV